MVHVFTIIFGVVFATIHIIAEWVRLYWHYPWLDMPMHVMGGLLAVLILSSLRQMRTPLRLLSRVWLALILVMVLLAWEGFGIYRFGGMKPDFWTDSILDLIFGMVGIVCGYILVQALEKVEAITK